MKILLQNQKKENTIKYKNIHNKEKSTTHANS